MIRFLGVVWPQWLYQAVWRHHRCPERVLWCPFESLPETQGLHGGAVDSRGQSSGEYCQVYHGENRWPDYNWLVHCISWLWEVNTVKSIVCKWVIKLQKFAFHREQAKERTDSDVGQKRLWLGSIKEMERITGQGQSNYIDLILVK